MTPDKDGDFKIRVRFFLKVLTRGQGKATEFARYNKETRRTRDSESSLGFVIHSMA